MLNCLYFVCLVYCLFRLFGGCLLLFVGFDCVWLLVVEWFVGFSYFVICFY